MVAARKINEFYNNWNISASPREILVYYNSGSSICYCILFPVIISWFWKYSLWRLLLVNSLRFTFTNCILPWLLGRKFWTKWVLSLMWFKLWLIIQILLGNYYSTSSSTTVLVYTKIRHGIPLKLKVDTTVLSFTFSFTAYFLCYYLLVFLF